MQWFLQVVRENDPHDGQSGAIARPDWWVGDMVFGRFFSDGTGVLFLVMAIAEPFPVPHILPKAPIREILRAPKTQRAARPGAAILSCWCASWLPPPPSGQTATGSQLHEWMRIVSNPATKSD
jgi:hypothetical protein